MKLPAGLSYSKHEVQGSRVHMLRVDLALREVRPVLAGDAFPFRQDMAHHAALRAWAQGALAVFDGGFNVTGYHGFGISDQPQHALVHDREVWTTGIGAGGYGFLVHDDGSVSTQKNRIACRVWYGAEKPLLIGPINLGHDEAVCAFTARGGANQLAGIHVEQRNAWEPREETPIPGKHYALLSPDGDWRPEGPALRRWMLVKPFAPGQPLAAGEVALEGRWKLPLALGTSVTWRQDLGAPGVRSIVSGWPEMVREGQNVVPLLSLDPEASRGPDAWFLRRNPRSALGASEDGRTAFVVVVEGRLPNSYRSQAEPSRGLRLKAFAEFCRKQGIWSMVNMDGGGSAFMQLGDRMVAPGCYNRSGTLEGQRPGQFCPAVF